MVNAGITSTSKAWVKAIYVDIARNCMHEQSYFLRNFTTWKRKKKRAERKQKETFDIYSFLFIFIISFSLNSFSLKRGKFCSDDEAFLNMRKNVVEMSFPIAAHQVVEIEEIASSLEEKHREMKNEPRTFSHTWLFLCSASKCNDNKLYCVRHVESCFIFYTQHTLSCLLSFFRSSLHTHPMRSFRFISPKKPKITGNTIHHFHLSSQPMLVISYALLRVCHRRALDDTASHFPSPWDESQFSSNQHLMSLESILIPRRWSMLSIRVKAIVIRPH